MFRNRHEAGLQLASLLEARSSPEALLLAIPRGGIEVACPIARQLNRPLDVIIPRKVPSPDNSELAIGAVTFDGSIEIDQELVMRLGLGATDLEELIQPVRAEIDRRLRLYRGDRAAPKLRGSDIVLIDDGLATGYTMMAAVKSVRREDPRSIIVAVPVSPESTYRRLQTMVNDVIVHHLARGTLFAVSAFYNSFRDLSDAELIQLLAACNAPTHKSAVV